MTSTTPVTAAPAAPDEDPGASLTTRLAAWARTVRYEDIPERTLAAARSQLVSNLAAVRGSLGHPVGGRIVDAFGAPLQPDAGRSAYVLAALATALDFDEVAYSGHVSAGAVNVAIAEAVRGGLDGRSLLTTIVVANECAARVSAATILSPFFRGQTNTHCHLASAAAARLHARRASEREWTAGLGMAFGILAVPLHHGVVTSDVKALGAAAPIRLALDACDAAAHGLAGPDAILEHPEGLLAHLSAVPLPDAVIEGLGRRWHTDTLTYKRFPGSAYLHAAFDCAERLHRRLGAVDASRVRRVLVHGSLLTWQMERKVARDLHGPDTSVSAATLSIGYGVATLLSTGTFGVRDLTPEAIGEAARWSLADKVTVEHDMVLSERMVRATSPLGEALRQAGDRALDWPELHTWGGADVPRILAGLGAPEETLENATMAIGARVAVELVDGSVVTEECEAFIGSAGPATRRDHRSLVREKFRAVGGPDDVLRELEDVDLLDPAGTARALNRAVDVSAGVEPN
ncbi:MmgE/PrpD family protein [Streptomyces sp. H27-G5]|uniref:MmgE/PrpD family protein n=1 Tax=Streptomyces sp. H27-G5 TaxID=2996698 RepID=UPI0022716227|nr:MmgE/PrpD family protein [Streptomyces sp. H27-G5]MCY0920561.1 MmgE/PrpD family protein [Streptomyces sp. H27-G5]